MKEEVIEHYSYWEDIQCEAVFTLHKREFGQSLDFVVYEIVGVEASPNKGQKIYEKLGATSSDDTTSDIKEAQPLFKGTIKWDACSHVTFGDDDGYIHLCGFHSWKNFSEAVRRVWNYATECGFSEKDFTNKL